MENSSLPMCREKKKMSGDGSYWKALGVIIT